MPQKPCGCNKVQEKVNKNRQVPVYNPPVKTGKVEPQNSKSMKGMGGGDLDSSSTLWKDILDSQLKRNVKEIR